MSKLIRHKAVSFPAMTPKADLDLLIEVRAAINSGRAARVRELAGLSQSEVAQLVGVTPAAISRWEAGERRPTGPRALAYGRVLRQMTNGVAAAA
jgi:DNA-binding transcriptional regulator YiaG